MEMKVLGGTGIRVSRFCLGAMMFGPPFNQDVDDCVRIIHRAIDAGINFIDTADAYSGGASEEIVGKALKGRRENIVLATKFFVRMGDDPNMAGGSRRWIVRAVEGSLRRLGTDHIDLYQIHRWDAATDIEETLFALTDLVRQGKIRAFGSSMFPADRIVEAQWTSERMGLMRFRCEQSSYSIFARDIERQVLPACRRYGMGTMTFSPLDGGFLTGKYRTSADFKDDSRIVSIAKRMQGGFDASAEVYRRKLALIGELSALAGEAGLSLPELAIAFVLEHPGVTSVLIGPRKMEHLESLLPAADLRLDEAVLDRIDALVPPGSSLNPIADMPSGVTKDQLRRPRLT